ncbi:hypothetical protein FQN53_001065 [Emmonsiellopsis sp. PD_33]|nr:hypothetical protein FQN53_001065 [Emmonsiellopsis sp. PD_33]
MVRSKDEPRSSAFAGYGVSWVQGRSFHEDDEDWKWGSRNRCSSETGCCMLLRPPLREISEDTLYEDDPEDGTLPDDPSYEYQSASEGEVLEYDSDASDSGRSTDEDNTPSEEDESETTEPDWIFKVSGPEEEIYDTEFVPLSTRLGQPLMIKRVKDDGSVVSTHNTAVYDLSQRYEHIAGPGCRKGDCYHPTNISPEEMRDAHTVQCIYPKGKTWQPRADDLDFERESRYHLTGLTTHMPSSGSLLEFVPPRFDVNIIGAECDFWSQMTKEELQEIGLPFHPACFELYIQASRRVLGIVDIDTLVHIRDKAAIAQEEFPIMYHNDVLAGRGQYWEHNPGDEYLVANPIFIPGFRDILESAISHDESFNIHNSPFKARPQKTLQSPSRDPFLRLPFEIMMDIAGYLGHADIANARLSSRAFDHIPISFWRRLVLEEMPWLYEAWSSDPSPYYWTTAVSRDLHEEEKAKKEFYEDLEIRREVIQTDMPEIYDEWVGNEPKWEWPEHPDRRVKLDMGPMKLPSDRTNWYKLYGDITKNRSQLKGLRNRERIWDSIMQIVDVVGAAREDISAW